LIVGDDAYSSFGPARFHRESLEHALSRVTHAVVHSGAADIRAYSLAASPAILGNGVIIVETTERWEGDWWDLVHKLAPTANKAIVSPYPLGGRA
jgi:hypothetical protein